MPQKKQSVYSKIAQDILFKIKNDTYPVGSMLPPERVLMEIYKVERTTIRRGLELLQRDGHIKKTAGLGSIIMSKDAVYTNDKASDVVMADNSTSVLPYQKQSLLALFPENDEKSYVLPIIESLKKLCAQNGVRFTLLESTDLSRVSSTCKTNDITSCVIFFDTSDEILQHFNNSNINTCFAFCKYQHGRCILPDIQGSCKAASQHLAMLGHTSIAFICTDDDSYYEREYKVHFTNEVLHQNPESEIEQYTNIGGNNERSGFDRLSELIRRAGGKFTAVVTANDKVAQGALKAAKYYKYRVPEDISVISLFGFDKGNDLTSLRAESVVFAAEIFNGCILCKKTDYGVTTLVHCSIYDGDTCSNAKDTSASSRKLSDFLL